MVGRQLKKEHGNGTQKITLRKPSRPAPKIILNDLKYCNFELFLQLAELEQW